MILHLSKNVYHKTDGSTWTKIRIADGNGMGKEVHLKCPAGSVGVEKGDLISGLTMLLEEARRI